MSDTPKRDTPKMARYEFPDGSVTYRIIRGYHQVHMHGQSWPRETAVSFDTVEWALIVRTVLADLGLRPLEDGDDDEVAG